MNNLLKILFFQIICLSNLAISAINVDNNLSATFSGIQAPRCSGDTGKFSFVIENGTPPYQFSIDNGQTYSLAYATDNLLENLNAGIYQVLVKDATETIVTVINPIDASDTIIFLDENSLTCEYCPSTATATVTEYIEEVSFHTINHISGNNLGYANFTNNPNISTTLSKGNTYTLTITPYHEYPSSNLPQLFWYVWIDYNGDYILSDDEAVVSGTGNLDDILVRNITIPSSAVSGTVMMRVQMKNFSETSSLFSSCNNDIIQGEVEDYAIEIVLEPFSATFTEIINPACPNTGSLTILPEGGIPPYAYSLRADGISEDQFFEEVAVFENLAASTYNVTVYDSNGSIVSAINPADSLDYVILEDDVYTLTCEYCLSTANATENTYIDKFEFGNISNTSGNNEGYADFTNLETIVITGQAYPITLTPFTSSPNETVHWKVWLDYNSNYNFSNFELMLEIESNEAIDTNIFIPYYAVAGTVIMRVQMQDSLTINNPCAVYESGEVEDYAVLIAKPLQAEFSQIIAPNCPDDGEFSIVASNGVPPYSYSIDNGVTYQTENVFENLLGGTYQVLVKDSNETVINAIHPTNMLDYVSFPDGNYTLACDYCEINTVNTVYEHIDAFELGDISNTSGNNQGYADFTHLSTTVTSGEAYPITLTPFNSENIDQIWNIWLDYNADNEFSDNELILRIESKETVNDTLIIPYIETTQTVMMRVQMQPWLYGSTFDETCGVFYYGEVEDYTIVIEAATSCPIPIDFSVLQTTSNSIVFDWEELGATGYNFRGRSLGSNNWLTQYVTESESPNLFTDIIIGQTYEWQVQTDCGNGNFSEWSSLQIFAIPVEECTALDGDDLTNLVYTTNGLAITLTWPEMPNAQAYQLAGRKVGGSIKVFPETQMNYHAFVNNIPHNTSYEWSVRVKCDGIWTEYAYPIKSFTTPAGGFKNNQAKIIDIFADKPNYQPLLLNIYPNPAQNMININFENSLHIFEKENQKYDMQILDINGTIVYTKSFQRLDNTIDISHLNTGTYFVEIKTAYNTIIEKLIIY